MNEPKEFENKYEKKTYKLIYFIIILILIIVFFLIDKIFPISTVNENLINRNLTQLEVNNEKTIEKEKLILKSNYEENREKKIIYIFTNNIISEQRIYEKYNDSEHYIKQKSELENIEKNEIIDINDDSLEIYYKRLDLGDEEGFTYEEIYNKYMGIIGAYEIVE